MGGGGGAAEAAGAKARAVATARQPPRANRAPARPKKECTDSSPRRTHIGWIKLADSRGRRASCPITQRSRLVLRGSAWAAALIGGGFGDGASRARTGDLLSATQALSQLSYS